MKFAILLLTFLYPMQLAAHGKPSIPQGYEGRAIEFPDAAGYRTLVVDLHTHSVFSDGHVWPVIRVGEAILDGLDAMAVTEHLEWQPHLEDLPHPDRNRAFYHTREAAEGTDLIVIAGSEITRDAPAGHMNAIFIQDANRLVKPASRMDPYDARKWMAETSEWPAQEAVIEANQQGAFVFWNHPYWTRQAPDGIARLSGFHENNVEKGLLHGIEIANGQNYSEEAFAIALKHGLTPIGVSDIHNLVDWDYLPHSGGHRPVTLVFATARSEAAIREALFDGRTVVWFRNMLIGREDLAVPLVLASLSVKDARYRGNSMVVAVTIANDSDAAYLLRNRSPMTFMDQADLLEVPAHGEITFQVKPGARLDSFDLEFDVLNVLTAPKTNPEVTLRVLTNI